MINLLKRIATVFLLLFSLVLSNYHLTYANETILPELIKDNEEVKAIEISNLRYSLASHRDRIVLDFNSPFTYQLLSSGTEILLSVDSVDKRPKKDYTGLQDKLIKDLQIIPDPVNPNKCLIKISLNYKVKSNVNVLANPDRLIIDLIKVFEEETTREIVSGLQYKHIYAGTTAGPLQVDTLIVDLHNLDLDIRPVVAEKNKHFSRATVTSLANQAGALAAINGTYFAADGHPLGLLLIDGKLLTYPWAGRTALGLTGERKVLIDNVKLMKEIILSDGQKIEADGMDSNRMNNQMVIYTKARGMTTKTNSFGWELAVVDNQIIASGCGDLVIPSGGYVISAHGEKKKLLENLQVGDQLQVKIVLTPNWLDEGVKHIISGGPRLVKAGSVFLTSKEELFRPDITVGKAPRSALGVTADGKLLLVAVTGRQASYSVGLTLQELAQLMVKLGAVDAMNLDGGGSTSLLVEGKMVTLPSDGQERPVSNALVITKTN